MFLVNIKYYRMVLWCQGNEQIFIVLLLLMVDAETYLSKLDNGTNYHNRAKRDVINKEMEDYLTRFGYLPQSDLETGALRTMQVHYYTFQF